MDAEWRKRFLSCEKHHWPGPMRCTHCAVEEKMALDAVTKTLAEWNEVGRRICKGAKMVGRNESGVPVFAMRDTYKPTPRGYGSADWDSDPGYSDLDISSFQG